MPVTPPPRLWHPKVPPDITKYPGVGVWWERGKSTLVLNYWSRGTVQLLLVWGDRSVEWQEDFPLKDHHQALCWNLLHTVVHLIWIAALRQGLCLDFYSWGKFCAGGCDVAKVLTWVYPTVNGILSPCTKLFLLVTTGAVVRMPASQAWLQALSFNAGQEWDGADLKEHWLGAGSIYWLSSIAWVGVFRSTGRFPLTVFMGLLLPDLTNEVKKG